MYTTFENLYKEIGTLPSDLCIIIFNAKNRRKWKQINLV